MSKDSEYIYQGSMSKVDRYKWANPGKPGLFKMIHKNQIIIPEDTYQRQAVGGDGDAKVLRIAANFSWVAFQVVAVVERDGAFYALDAGHRLRAAKKREDITMLPCMVYELASIQDEAKAFDITNSNRKPMSAVDRHRAHIIQGDSLASQAEHYAKMAGRIISKNPGPGTICCVNDLKRCISVDNEALGRIWPLITELCRGEKLTKDVINGIFYIERFASERVSSRRISEKMLKIGYRGVMHAAREGAAYYGSYTPRAIADGMLKAINKGLHDKVEIVE